MFFRFWIVASLIFISCTAKKSNIDTTTHSSKDSTTESQVPPKDLIWARQQAISTILGATPHTGFPIKIDNDAVAKLDSTHALSQEQIRLLSLNDIAGYGEHFLHIPLAQFAIDSITNALIVVRYYVEESTALLLTYSKDGDLLDYTDIYYDNSEGNSSTNVIIPDKKTLHLKYWGLYDADGKTTYDTLSISSFGSICPSHETAHAVELAIGAKRVKSSFVSHNQKYFDIIGDGGEVSKEHRIVDSVITIALWGDTIGSERYDTASIQEVFYSHNEINDNISAICVRYLGGCNELWCMIVNSMGVVRGRFMLSGTCMSDGEDYSSGIFLRRDLYEFRSTWTQEYPEKGEDINKKVITRYHIQKDGSVNVLEIAARR